jgi:hypothetical protein
MQPVLVSEPLAFGQAAEAVPGMVVGPVTNGDGGAGVAAVVAVKVAEVPEEGSPTVMTAV